MSLRPLNRIALSVVTATAVVALTGIAGTGAADAAASKPADKPTIVLVHGAWADSSSFAGVTEKLQHDGYTVLAAPNPLRGLATDAATVAAFVNQATTGPVVLVGHSYGGAVITNAANQTPTVKALAYIDAFAPDQGETIVQLAGSVPGSALAADPAEVFDVVQDPNLPEGDPDLYVKKSIFREAFAANLGKSDVAVLAASQRPVAGGALQEPSGVPAWKTLPSFFLVGTNDKIIPADGQLAMAQRAGGTIVKVKTDHLSMIEKPNDVAKLIERAAGAGK
ncbi:alpha/beta hydrolase [Conyzicola nivalis]|uniref:Alpha/beta hydrolase n=1 Tax=Conyzicola nivalis TaxID=1477021 RepID=A0A916WJ15_9MICO|nr:alpha/beta hydrolase [Conyzicola nivalis]GGB04655.1 alpha/beta hydrolase [Conyzicola nivalis]